MISVPPYLRVDDGVADLDVERDDLAGLLGATAGADGQDLALLGLLLGGVGDDEAAGGRLLGLAGPDDDAVLEGLQVHGRASVLALSMSSANDTPFGELAQAAGMSAGVREA